MYVNYANFFFFVFNQNVKFYYFRETARRDEEISLEEEIRKKLTITGYVFRDRKPRLEKIEFPGMQKLDDGALELIKKVWHSGGPLDEKFGERITRRDLLTLRGLDWLNDEVINTYLGLICERAKKNCDLPKVYAFSTFFYTSLEQSGYLKVKRWTRKIDIFSYDIILVPVHLGAHWCLAVIDFETKCIEYYDSMGGINNQCLHLLKSYLQEESMDKKKEEFSLDSWEFYCCKDIPHQKNGSDCGMFACKFADFRSRRAQIIFSQENMPYFRQRMVYEICKKSLM
uniref:ULP_PROTEASE domain-containing protein n=1 Tax=Syphacia muris TaxID=451379 RepID=A0A0N5AY07_9BILA